MAHHRARAFTLIELLVTMTVIALLLGILLPVLPRVMDSARRSACGANLRGIGQGVQLFLDNNDGKFPEARYMPPPWLTGDDDPPFPEAMADYIEPYTRAYICPGDKTVHSSEWIDDQGEVHQCGSSYTYVAALSGQTHEETFFVRFLRRGATDTPVMHDFDGGTFEKEDGSTETVDFFHSRRMFLFVDGHVSDNVN